MIRGINVGGRKIVKMAQLKSDLEDLGCASVATYIQSGNVVLDAAGAKERVSEMIVQAIEGQSGFRPQVIVVSPADLRVAVAANPFAASVEDPKTMHFFMSQHSMEANGDALERDKAPTEEWAVVGNVLYLLAPDGIARSKIAANAEKYTGKPTTARNLRTIDKLLSMASAK